MDLAHAGRSSLVAIRYNATSVPIPCRQSVNECRNLGFACVFPGFVSSKSMFVFLRRIWRGLTGGSTGVLGAQGFARGIPRVRKKRMRMILQRLSIVWLALQLGTR